MPVDVDPLRSRQILHFGRLVAGGLHVEDFTLAVSEGIRKAEWWNRGIENHVLVISSEASFDEQRPTRLDKLAELLARFLLADQMPGRDDHAIMVIVQAPRLDKVNC